MTFDAPERIRPAATNADVTVGPGPMSLSLSGENLTVQGAAGTRAAPTCDDARFVPFPGR